MKKAVYILGHKNPGTDSALSAAACAKLKELQIRRTLTASPDKKVKKLQKVSGILPSALEVCSTGEIVVGMIPKVNLRLGAPEYSVPRALIIGRSVPHSLLSETCSASGIGTVIFKS